MKKKILIGLAVLFVISQFINRIDKTVPDYDKSKDFLTMTQAPANVVEVFKTACYDCHSYETRYPWYSNVAPMSWMVGHHINEAREEMNLSRWGELSEEDQKEKTEDMIDAFENGWMPLGTYTMIHRDALIPFKKRYEIADWLKK